MDLPPAKPSRSRARQLLTKLIEVDKVINNIHAKSSELGEITTSKVMNPPFSPISKEPSQSRRSGKAKGKLPLSAPGMPTRKKHPPPLKSETMAVSSDASLDSLDGGFNKPQMSYCPKCYKELPLGALRRHMAEQCPNNDVSCPEHDCNAVFSADHLKIHLATECLPARRKRKLAELARMRKAKEEEVARLAQEAALVYVEPKKAPIKDHFVMDDVSVEGVTSSRPESPPLPPSPLKEVEVSEGPCGSCGRVVQFSHMTEHLISSCVARLVYCPNHHGGCGSRVPYNGIDEHLKSSCLIEKLKNEMIAKAAARCVLVKCIGCGQSFEVKNLPKHELTECVQRKVPCRNAHLGCTTMVRQKDRHKHEEVDGKAKIRFGLYMTGEGSYLDLGEDDIRCPWTCEFWLYRVSSREAVKQHIRNALEMVPLFYDAFNTEYVWKAQMDELTNALKDTSIGVDAREEIMSVLADTVEALEDAAVVTTEVSTAIGCTLMAAKRAMTEFLGPNAELVRTKADSEAGQKLLMELMCLKRYPPGHTAPYNETRISSKATTRPGTQSRPGTHLGSRPGSPSRPGTAFVDGSLVVPVLPEWKPPTGAFGISSLGVLCQLCPDPHEMEVSAAPEKLVKPEKSAMDRQSADTTASTAGPSADQNGATDETRGGESRIVGDVPDEQPTDAPSNDVGANDKDDEDNDGDSDSFVEPEPLQAVPTSAALIMMQALKKDDRGEGGVGILTKQLLQTILPWADWFDVIELYNHQLNSDLLALHNLRVASGIIKEEKKIEEEDDSLTEEGSNAPQLTEEELAAKEEARRKKKEEEEKRKKKEKDKLRREMKRNKGKKAQLEEAKAEAEAEGGSDAEKEEEKSPEELQRLRRKEERELKRAAREKLEPRLIDAAKSAAGRDVIMFSDSANKRGAYNKICLDMSYPGEYNDWTKKKGEKQKFWFDNQGGGQVGVVCADTVLGGAERYSFGKSIPREKWVHLSFSATTEPHNRITMLMDGMLVGQLKDCAFPLPMACLAGAKALSGFSGILLDTRVWTKQRSAAETRATMSILLDLNGPQEPAKKDHDITSKGLVAWWTYEDGPEKDEQEKALDVSEHRAPSLLDRHLMVRQFDPDHDSLVAMNAEIQKIRKLSLNTSHNFNNTQGKHSKTRYWSWENADDCPLPFEKPLPPGQDRPLPVPPYSAMGLCLFELKRLRLAQKGRQLHKQVTCPLGCDDFILKKDLRMHLTYHCEFRKVKCRHAPLCRSTFPEFEREEHEASHCKYIIKQHAIVERSKKNRSMKSCPQCSMHLKVKDLERHQNEECVHRVISCPHADCEEQLQAHRLKYHLRYECESKAITVKAMLVQRARERSPYARDWGVTIEYEDEVEDEAGLEPTIENDNGDDQEKVTKKVVILPPEFHQDLSVDRPAEQTGDDGGITTEVDNDGGITTEVDVESEPAEEKPIATMDDSLSAFKELTGTGRSLRA